MTAVETVAGADGKSQKGEPRLVVLLSSRSQGYTYISMVSRERIT